MVSCIEVVHRFGHPAAGAKRITSLPNHVLYVRSLCFVKCRSLNCGHLPSKILDWKFFLEQIQYCGKVMQMIIDEYRKYRDLFFSQASERAGCLNPRI